MPKIRRNNTKFPKGFEIIEDVLDEFEEKMREAVIETHEGKRKTEALWPILRINHQRSRYVYQQYKKKKIDKKVYQFCQRQKYTDKALQTK